MSDIQIDLQDVVLQLAQQIAAQAVEIAQLKVAVDAVRVEAGPEND